MPGQTGQKNANFAVSTNMVSMFDENSNQLRIAGYDTGLQVAIWVPSISPEGRMTFPQEGRHSVVLSQTAVAALDYIIKNQLMDRVVSGQEFKKGVPTGRNATSFVDLIHKDGAIYIRISKDADANKVAKEVYLYKFMQDPVTVGYNPQTGEFETEMIDAQFALFCNTISAYAAFSMPAGHGAHVGEHFELNRMFRYLQGIATKLGVTITTEYTNGGGSTQQSGSQAAYQGQINEASDISALLS